MDRATRLADLYKASVQEYIKTPEEWKGLLSCVARFYKRSFDNVVLIYAQKPNAIQLGTFDEWHDKRIGRSINKGAKSIAVIDMVNPNASIKYLFDLLDTNGSIQSYREIMLRFHEKYQFPVDSIEACLHGLAGKRTKEMMPAYLDRFPGRRRRQPTLRDAGRGGEGRTGKTGGRKCYLYRIFKMRAANRTI